MLSRLNKARQKNIGKKKDLEATKKSRDEARICRLLILRHATAITCKFGAICLLNGFHVNTSNYTMIMIPLCVLFQLQSTYHMSLGRKRRLLRFVDFEALLLWTTISQQGVFPLLHRYTTYTVVLYVYGTTHRITKLCSTGSNRYIFPIVARENMGKVSVSPIRLGSVSFYLRQKKPSVILPLARPTVD